MKIAHPVLLSIARSVLLSIALLSVSVSASAQCLDYVEGFRPTGMTGPVKAITVFDAGNGPQLYAGGHFLSVHGEPQIGVVRLEGSRWRPLSPAVNGICDAFAVYDDGSGPALYIGGPSFDIDGVLAGSLVRWNGITADVPGGGMSGPVTALEVFDGAGTGPMLYAAGNFDHAGGLFVRGIARWNGSQWSPIGGAFPGVQGGIINCLHAGADTIGPALFAGGTFSAAGGVGASKLARYDGAQWSAVGNGTLIADVMAVTTWNSPTGPRVVAGGSFFLSGGNVSEIGEWDGTSWSNMAGGTNGIGFPPNPPHPYVHGLAVLDAGNGPRVYATGTFYAAGGNYASKIAAWDGSAWTPLGSGLMPDIVSIYSASGNVLETLDLGNGPRLYVGGDFVRAGTALANNIASYDGTRFEALGEGNALALHDQINVMTSFDDGSGEALWMAGMTYGAAHIGQDRGAVRFDGQTWSAPPLGLFVNAFATFDDGGGTKLYAGGSGVGTPSVMRWDGAAWTPLPGGSPPVSNCRTLCAFDDGNGEALYVASDGGANFYRWRNHVWTAISPSPYGITHLVVHDDGSGPALFAGGFFDGTAGVPIQSVARFDGTAWSDVGFPHPPPWGGLNVTSLAVHDDGNGPKLFVGGWFPGGLMRWDGSSWFSIDLGAAKVNALATFDDGTGHGEALYIASGLGTSGTPAVSRLKRWDGSTMTDVGAGLTGGGLLVQALSTFDDGTTRSLYVGGRFQKAGAHVSQGIARIDACGQTGEVFCFGDGSSGACPCGNASGPRERAGCRNSFGFGGALRASGRSSLSGDTASLDGSAMTNAAVLYVQGAHESSGVPFGDGIKCTTGPFVRLGTRLNAGGASSFPGGVGPSLSVRGLVVAPGSRYYQARYRNASAFCTSDTFNYTNGVGFLWGP